MIDEIACKIAVRVNYTDAVAVINNLQNEIAQERRLARSGFSDAVDMLAAVSPLKAKWLLIVPDISTAKKSGCIAAF